MFKRNCVRMFHGKKLKYDEFSKNLCKHHFWLVGQCGKNLFRQALLHTTYVDTLKQLSCKISAKLADSLKSYATFHFFI